MTQLGNLLIIYYNIYFCLLQDKLMHSDQFSPVQLSTNRNTNTLYDTLSGSGITKNINALISVITYRQFISQKKKHVK